jgi:UDP-2-acetamido-3-amino-2,3-dideoxy-glucuronate N-acetyltransferase
VERQEMSRVAVVGCGYWGKNLIRNFYDLGALTHICDSDKSRLEEVQRRYPGLRIERSYDQILSSADIDAIVISTPAEQHARMCEAGLLSGKDVFVEKPLALRYVDGEKLVSLAERRHRILMVGHLVEYHPAILKLKRIVDEGGLGEIRYIYSNRLNLGRVRTEENILWSFAAHDIGVLLRLVGDLPLEVRATGGAYLQSSVVDVAVTNLRFGNGVRAHIFVSWLHPDKEHRLVVIGSKKTAVFNDTAERDKLLLYDRGIDWVGGEPVARRGAGVTVGLDSVEPLRAECLHFLNSLESRQRPMTDGHHGLRVLKVLEACQTSLLSDGGLQRLADAPREST